MILTASIYIVFALLMIVCALLLLIVLMQRPKQEGLGAAFGAQMTDQAEEGYRVLWFPVYDSLLCACGAYEPPVPAEEVRSRYRGSCCGSCN